MMIDANKIIDSLQERGGALIERLRGDPQARTVALAGAGGLLAGLLAGRASPRFAGAAARVGGVAALGGLAYWAWKRHQARQSGQTPPAGDDVEAPPSGFLAAPPEAQGKLVLRAMINAVKADGRIDAEERARLFDRLGAVSLSDEEQEFLFKALAGPMDTEGLVAEASATPGLAAQVYAASVLAVDADQPAEKAYLADLANRLGLPDALVRELHAATT